MREPLLLPFAAMACGVALARVVAFSIQELIAIAVAMTILGLLAPRTPLKRTSFLLAMGAAGCLVALLHNPPTSPELETPDQTPVILSGCVVEPSITAHGREQFVLEIAPGARARVNWYLQPGQAAPDVHYGQRIEFPAKMRRPHNYGNPGAFDYVRYLARQQVYWSATTLQGAELTTLPGRCGSRFWAAIFAIRSAALTRIRSLYQDDPYTVAMMEAILIGESANLQKLWTDDYRVTGTFHALVISGSHVAVLAAALIFMLRIGFVPQNAAVTFAVAAAWLYCLITGWQAPVVRSAAALTFFAVGRLFFRRTRMLNIVAAVGICFLLLDPDCLFDASAQLSFLSVALIAVFVVPVIERTSGAVAGSLGDAPSMSLPRKAAQLRVELNLAIKSLTILVPGWLARFSVHAPIRLAIFFYDLLLTSAAIQIGLAIPMVLYFHRLSATGLSANAAALPLLELVVPIGFVSLFLNSEWVAALATFLLHLTDKTVAFHARWEPNYRIPDPPLWLDLLFVAFLVIAALRLPRQIRIAAFGCALAALAVLAVHPFPAIATAGTLEVTTIDVGQGDSLLVSFPNGKLILVDTGGLIQTNGQQANLEIGEDVVAPYLWTRGIQHLDAVAITHFHDDHAGGLKAILKDFAVAELWTGAVPRAYPLPEHIATRALLRGQPFAYGGATIQVLSPGPDYTPKPAPTNNDSLVLRLTYGRHSFLLTGDAEKQVEARLLDIPRTDVLKVGHHGSKTSSTPAFLDAVHPAFALISDGWENRFHHPHPKTLAALEERHIAISRTDLEGLTTVRTDGRYITIDPAPLPVPLQAPLPDPPP